MRKRPPLIVDLKQFLSKCLIGRTQGLIRTGIRKRVDETRIVFLAREIWAILDLLVLKLVVVEKYVSTRRVPQSAIEVS